MKTIGELIIPAFFLALFILLSAISTARENKILVREVKNFFNQIKKIK